MGNILNNCARDDQLSSGSPPRSALKSKFIDQPTTQLLLTGLQEPSVQKVPNLEHALEQIFLLCESGVATTIQFLFDHYPELTVMLNERRVILVGDTRMELTPLQVAVACGYVDVTSLLLSQPTVDLNCADPHFAMTALHLAVNLGHTFVLEVLCKDVRANVNEKTNEGKTALHLAVELCYPSMVETILRLHPTIDLRTRDFDGNNVFHLAAYQPNLRVISLLVNHASLVNLYADSFDPASRDSAVGLKRKQHRQIFEVGVADLLCPRLYRYSLQSHVPGAELPQRNHDKHPRRRHPAAV
jgi:hypothetical protein